MVSETISPAFKKRKAGYGTRYGALLLLDGVLRYSGARRRRSADPRADAGRRAVTESARSYTLSKQVENWLFTAWLFTVSSPRYRVKKCLRHST